MNRLVLAFVIVVIDIIVVLLFLLLIFVVIVQVVARLGTESTYSKGTVRRGVHADGQIQRHFNRAENFFLPEISTETPSRPTCASRTQDDSGSAFRSTPLSELCPGH